LEERIMTIAPFIDGMSFDSETRRVTGVAYEMTRTALRLIDRGDMANAFIAKRIGLGQDRLKRCLAALQRIRALGRFVLLVSKQMPA
jgi:hypothetical protein